MPNFIGLPAFIKVGRDNIALKLMATIVGNNSKFIDWAVFFGVKQNALPPGITAGTIKDGTTDIICNPVHPILLIPVSDNARKEAIRVRGLRISTAQKQVPDIRCSGLSVRNSGSPVEDGNWNNYKFWYENEDAWPSDPFLYWGDNRPLTKLSDKGDWYDLMVDGQTPSAVWLTTARINAPERAILFLSPACQLIDSNGHYLNHVIWLGLTTDQNGPAPIRPCIAISQEQSSISGSDFCAIRWNQDVRVDDLLEPRTTSGNSQTPEFITADQWTDNHSILKAHDDDNRSNGISAILDDFQSNIVNFDLKLWFIWEKIKGEDGVLRIFFNTVYFRHYALYSYNGSLYKLIGRGRNSDDIQIINMFQISRPDGNHIFTSIRFIGDQEINTLWNVPASAIKNGLDWVTAAAPVGLVPQMKKFSNRDYKVVSEWLSAGDGDCFTTTGNYALASSYFFNADRQPGVETLEITLPKLRTQHFSPLLVDQTDESNNNNLVLRKAQLVMSVANPSVDDDGTLFQFRLKSYQFDSDNTVLRDGALAFTLDKTTFDDNPAGLPTNLYGRFRITLQLLKAQQPFFLWQWYADLDKTDRITAFYSIEDFSLPVKKVEAASQDSLTRDNLLAPAGVGAVAEGFGERPDPALVIPLGPPSTEKRYLLTLSESINIGQSHRVDIRLQEFDPAAGKDNSTNIKAVIIDTSPQLLTLVDARFLQQPGYDDGAWVLARRSPLSADDSGWELLNDSADTEGFFLVLPSQGVGEAYVKGVTTTGANPIPPADGEPKEGEPIEYRFAAPAILRLAPEKLDTRYVSAPWNLRRIWGQAGDAAPGTPLLEAQFELLYGMMVNLKPAKTLLAELGSRLGEVPVPPANSLAWAPTVLQQNAFRTAWQYYLRFYRAWLSRLAVLEPAIGDDAESTIFDTDTQDLHFNLRIQLTKRLETVPDPSGNGNTVTAFLGRFDKKGADLKHPNPQFEYGPQQPATTPDALFDNEKIATHSKTGLAGGAVYGFESTAIYDEFLQQVYTKGSSSGEMLSLAFSSLGGWGKQTAKFAGDKTIIKSNTAMGRTHYYAVERIGRIGVFWHKAKHVIEYERTVVPSRQFMAFQPGHPGRALVRKVREYVEILEPSMSYPDNPKDAVDAPGSVTGLTFKSLIIPVLSSWGQDVNDKEKGSDGKYHPVPIGWEVPLWKPGADPVVYPKPQVVLSLLPPADADDETILRNLSEPENLWFYTDTRESAPDEKGSPIVLTANNVHSWPAVQDVDYCNLPVPEQYDIEPSLGDSPEILSAPMPDVLDVHPGFERYTFRVDPNDLPASVAGRYFPAAGMTGKMRTVSMMRCACTPATDDWAKSVEQKTLAALSYGNTSLLFNAARGFQVINQTAANGKIPVIGDYVTKVADDLGSGGLPGMLATLAATDVSAPTQLHYLNVNNLWPQGKDLSYPVKWLWRESLETGDGLISRVMQYYTTRENQLLTSFDADIAQAKQAGETALKTAKDIFDRFSDNITSFRADTELTVDGTFSRIKGMIDGEIESISNQVDKRFDAFLDFIDAIDPTGDLQTIKQSLEGNITSFFPTVIRDTGDVLDDLANTNAKWKDSIVGLKNKILAILSACQTEMTDIVNNSINTGTDFINEVSQAIRNTATDYKNQIDSALDTMEDIAHQPLDDLQQGYAVLNNKLKAMQDQLVQQVGTAIAAVGTAWSQGAEIGTTAAKASLEKIKTDLSNFLIGVITDVLFKADQTTCVFTILHGLDGWLKELEDKIKSNLISYFKDLSNDASKVEDWVGSFDACKRLKDAIGSNDINSILNASTDLANRINQKFGSLTGDVAQRAKDAMAAADSEKAVLQAMKQTLTNFRSVWEEFTAPGMGLNRKTVAMLVSTNWQDVERRLSITPCIARVKQFGEQLEGLGLRMPVVGITDRLLPAGLNWNDMRNSLLGKFDFSNLFSDLGGMRFDKLFPGLKMPDTARDNIKITQGFDKQNLMAWVNAEADVLLNGMKDLMSIGPLSIQLENGRFTGAMRLSIDIDGKTSKSNSGKLVGSWHINIAGTGLMIFRDAGILFQDGKLTFDMDPKRMEMPGLLKLLTDATQNLTGGGGDDEGDSDDSVFKIGLVKVKGIPAGVRATLDLPPISVGGGTTAITNLCFGGHFQILALDPELRFKFLLGLGFYLGKKEAPFSITVFILGGGGFIDCQLTYAPSEGLSIDFIMSLDASASIAIAAGFMTGYVAIMIGFQGEYHKTPTTGSNVYITIFVRVIGMIDLMGIVTVLLYLSLEATYKSLPGGGSQLVGTGQVKLEIRICRFFTIKVDKSYSKVFAGSGNSSSGARIQARAIVIPDVPARAQKILNSLS
jgi:hypothetical protein